MPKKKTSKTTSRKVSTRPVSGKHEDHSFLIILGGGFVVLVLVMFFMGNQASLTRSAMSKVTTAQVNAEKNQTISISNFAFSPKTITVKAGSSVTWMNSDTVDHSIVADDASFDIGVLAPGEKGSYTFSNAGTYVYHCGVHPSMTATVVVE
jgi:plastocyanin